jgi:hypothetical protein
MRVSVFIISWEEKNSAALAIYDELQGFVEQLVVIYSAKDEAWNPNRKGWIRVPNSHFYGLKFCEVLKNFDGDLLLQIQADATCEDWRALVRRMSQVFNSEAALGVWAPTIDYTPFDLGLVRVLDSLNGLVDVVMTDGIVWAIRKEVLNRLRLLDYSINNFGWGIEWAAICYSYTHNLRVVIDETVLAQHPPGRGYPASEAARQMHRFLSQMTRQEKSVWVTLYNHFLSHRSKREKDNLKK